MSGVDGGNVSGGSGGGALLMLARPLRLFKLYYCYFGGTDRSPLVTTSEMGHRQVSGDRSAFYWGVSRDPVSVTPC